MKENKRFDWAVAVLEVRPSDHVLELGCGVGMAVERIAPKLVRGSITAIDRSQAMIGRASERNRAFIEKKKALVLKHTLLTLRLKPHSYNKIFAFNVNVFWTTTALKELDVIRQHLARNGTLYLFYQPPTTSKLKMITETVSHHLQLAKFRVRSILYESDPAIASCCIIAQDISA
jgi:cyclopropane fatty-acyl-phospholipid synthase-like methyltransferase